MGLLGLSVLEFKGDINSFHGVGVKWQIAGTKVGRQPPESKLRTGYARVLRMLTLNVSG
jgi:hypothetical protein